MRRFLNARNPLYTQQDKEGRRGEREFATKRPKRVSLQFTPADPDAPYYPNPLPASPPRGRGRGQPCSIKHEFHRRRSAHNSKRACVRLQDCSAHAVPGSVLPHSLNDESRSPLHNKGPLRKMKSGVPQWERTLTEREVPLVCLPNSVVHDHTSGFACSEQSLLR